jgi:hypothetical protein
MISSVVYLCFSIVHVSCDPLLRNRTVRMDWAVGDLADDPIATHEYGADRLRLTTLPAPAKMPQDAK